MTAALAFDAEGSSGARNGMGGAVMEGVEEGRKE